MKRCAFPPAGDAADQAAFVRAAVPVLRTARLTLRAPRLEDLPLWTEAWQSHSPEDTDEELWEGFCVYVAGWMLHGHGLWTVELRTSGDVVGFLQLGLEWGDEEPEIGWAVLPKHQRNGYASEAAAAVRDHAASLLGPGRAVSYINPSNTASAATAARVGAHRDTAAEQAFDGGSHVWRHGVRS